ncbi:DegT/DnrJ/EryC1/StrS family aminotransferase [Xylanibacter ruminicola]|uniref:dTDP-4-amino-4,6-dideoxygalactose transaminase n=1 Tax=Xylanibacter ruminicola TaxID=839 RepID=A0A1M6XHI0_XYLRU|nr:DegT/DnrJ/EryC1/StrS aminotransferase family protein [Xylanibacter ruminicola]SHL05427.1 dTDP-4-amino-4,6-dideoxygalactose transaminase [Xylanibacter ruminicola]
MKIPFSPPDITQEEAQEVAAALLSGWITTGPRTKEFERQIARFCETNVAVCQSSATACLEAILRILGVGPGDEVITSAYTYTATASPVCHVGAKLVFVDTQQDSYEMDYEQLANAINERTKVVIPVDIGGVPCNYAAINRIVESKRHLFKPANEIQEAIGHLIVIDDAAHAFGASWQGKKVGSVADFTSFSFHAVKNFTTAEGGALMWKPIKGIDDDWIYQQFQLNSLHGQSKDALSRARLGSWEYDILTPAYKSNMTDLTAAIGLVQMKRYPAMLKRRRELIEHYNQELSGLNLQLRDHYNAEHISSGHLYQVRLLGYEEKQRNEVIVKMAERDIACNVHFKPLPMMTAYKKLGFDISNYPHAYNQFKNEITLPLYTKLTDEQVEYVIKNFKEVI